jgi:CRP-like cAMP-binding protein
MDAAEFRNTIGRLKSLAHVIRLYTQALFTHLAQSAACNGIHRVEPRCARWLLQTHDRVDSDEFPVTHDYLAKMLGVRRAGVTEAAQALQNAGCIRYQQGRVEVLSRKRLQEASCECYGIITAEYERLIGPGWSAK